MEMGGVAGEVDSRYTDYARTNASIGINGVVLNNVNADPRILRRDYLKKVAAWQMFFVNTIYGFILQLILQHL